MFHVSIAQLRLLLNYTFDTDIVCKLVSSMIFNETILRRNSLKAITAHHLMVGTILILLYVLGNTHSVCFIVITTYSDHL